jgi:hypothetical protein
VMVYLLGEPWFDAALLGVLCLYWLLSRAMHGDGKAEGVNPPPNPNRTPSPPPPPPPPLRGRIVGGYPGPRIPMPPGTQPPVGGSGVRAVRLVTPSAPASVAPPEKRPTRGRKRRVT